MDTTRSAAGLHPTCDIDYIAPEVERKLVRSDDSRDNRSCMEANADL